MWRDMKSIPLSLPTSLRMMRQSGSFTQSRPFMWSRAKVLHTMFLATANGRTHSDWWRLLSHFISEFFTVSPWLFGSLWLQPKLRSTKHTSLLQADLCDPTRSTTWCPICQAWIQEVVEGCHSLQTYYNHIVHTYIQYKISTSRHHSNKWNASQWPHREPMMCCVRWNSRCIHHSNTRTQRRSASCRAKYWAMPCCTVHAHLTYATPFCKQPEFLSSKRSCKHGGKMWQMDLPMPRA